MKLVTKKGYEMLYKDKFPLVKYINPFSGEVVKNKVYFINEQNEKVFVITNKAMKDLTKGANLIAQ